MISNNSRSYKPITDFSKSNLSGRYKSRIVVSNTPNPYDQDFLFESRIRHNWPSQGRPRYQQGYIKFDNYRRFDRARQTIGGVKVHLFFYEEVGFLYELATEKRRFIEKLNGASDGDFFAAAELLIRLLLPSYRIPKFGWRPMVEGQIGPHLSVIGLTQLRELSGVLDKPVPAAPAKAA